MAPSARYRQKTRLVQAVQWTGRNLDEVVKFVDPDSLRYEKLSDGMLTMTSKRSGGIALRAGQWILLAEGRYSVSDSALFDEQFEKEKEKNAKP